MQESAKYKIRKLAKAEYVNQTTLLRTRIAIEKQIISLKLEIEKLERELETRRKDEEKSFDDLLEFISLSEMNFGEHSSWPAAQSLFGLSSHDDDQRRVFYKLSNHFKKDEDPGDGNFISPSERSS